ncbi:MAG TPA: hypothetical protein VKN18_06530 [Blastocatellia bacterium]|nr:hypothetical protein [Blastocatellia bacterium]
MNIFEKKYRAQELVKQFRERGAQARRPEDCVKDSIWLNVCRNKVADGLDARILDPNKINQSKTNVCGIAAFVRDWAEDDPIAYAWLGISLYEAGWGRIGRGKMLGKEVRPSSHLRSSPIPYQENYYGNGHAKEMNHADWIVLASIRESFNNVFAYTANDPLEMVSGMTLPSEVVKTFKAAGYTSVVDKTNWALGEGFDNVQEASSRFKNKEKVVLLINMRMLKDSTIDTEAAVVRTSDHWVGLLSPIELKLSGTGYRVSGFDVFTWGEKRRVPQTTTDFAFTAFLKNYYGFIAAKY